MSDHKKSLCILVGLPLEAIEADCNKPRRPNPVAGISLSEPRPGLRLKLSSKEGELVAVSIMGQAAFGYSKGDDRDVEWRVRKA
jgi:hypothetical protein